MKALRYILPTLLLLAQTIALNARESEEGKIPFKMILRLWPAHYNDSQLSIQLIEALKEYPGWCDEVWMCGESPISPMAKHQASAAKMSVLAQKMREIGVTPSIQIISIGHGEKTGTKKETEWESMVGPDGYEAATMMCPRGEKFLRHMEEVSALYTEAVKPYGYWIDDDLRLTNHDPVKYACFCDGCIDKFNKQTGHQFTRSELLAALDNINIGMGYYSVRKQWIRFCQEGLAYFASAAARGVHKASAQTHMGLQHTGFHRHLYEGYDWNPIFNAYERETGLAPLSRPGCLFYNDAAPRGMFEKGLDIARQIRRLNGNITEIAPEIESYYHKSTGKSPHGICIETMYYLAMGATQMSYAIICSASEPMEWYASHYFKHLSRWHQFAKEYAHYNQGTEPGGVNPYISKEHAYTVKGDNFGWTHTDAGTEAYSMAALGVPFCPDGNYPRALMLDGAGIKGITDTEFKALAEKGSLVVDIHTWKILQARKLTEMFTKVSTPAEAGSNPCYETAGGGRLTIINYKTDITGAERLRMLKAIDWTTRNTLPAIIESRAQAALIPRIEKDGTLRSVAILNCSISEEDSYTLRLRAGKATSFIWKKNGQKDIKLKPRREGKDVILTVPMLEGWNFGWIAIK